MALSDSKIRQLKPAEKHCKVSDEKGMFLLVKTTGAKLWQMKYRFEGKENIFSIGSYPEVSLKEARERRDSARTQLANGTNPNTAKRSAKASQSLTNSFAVIAREWYDKQLPAWAPATAKKRLALLENDLFPWMGARQMDGLTSKDLLTGLQRIEARGAKDIAHNAPKNHQKNNLPRLPDHPHSHAWKKSRLTNSVKLVC